MLDDLRVRGHRFLLEPAARTFHLNVSLPSFWLVERFDGGRIFAAARCRDWQWGKRLGYAAGSPLIPFVRLSRVVAQIRRSGRAHALLPGVLPALIIGLVASAAGEACGYVTGPGTSSGRLFESELHRVRYLRGREPRDVDEP
jgi:hypothetical protein